MTLGMIMYQLKFISGNKCTTLMSDADSEVGSAWSDRAGRGL